MRSQTFKIMKAPYGYCPEEGCGKPGLSLEGDIVTCSHGHSWVYSNQSSQVNETSGDRSKKPGVKQTPPSNPTGGSGFKRRAGKSVQAPAEATTASSPGLGISGDDLDIGPSSETKSQPLPSGQSSGNAREMTISEFIANAQALEDTTMEYKKSLSLMKQRLKDLLSELDSMDVDS